jgi:hypothetical protein
MKQTLIGLTLIASLTAGVARAEEEPVGRYVTIALPNGDIVVTDTQKGKVKRCIKSQISGLFACDIIWSPVK